MDNLGHPDSHGIVFTTECIESAIERWKMSESKAKALCGMCLPKDPLDDGCLEGALMTGAACELKSLYLEGSSLMADVEILDTFEGNMLKALLDDGQDIKLYPNILYMIHDGNATDVSFRRFSIG